MSEAFNPDTEIAKCGDKYIAQCAAGWGVLGNMNGGYLQAIAGRAMSAESGRAIISLNAHFLRPVNTGEISIVVKTLKTGCQFSNLSAQVLQQNKPCMELLSCLGEVPEFGGSENVLGTLAPQLPAPEDCIPIVPGAKGLPPPLMGQVDARLHPEDASFIEGGGSSEAQIRAWLNPGHLAGDVSALLLAVDVFPQTIFALGRPRNWTPTLELTTHIRQRPPQGFLRCHFTTRFLSDRFFEEDSEIWDESGSHLLAQSRQLALIGR